MKIKLSKSQWEEVGKKAGWMKTADRSRYTDRLSNPEFRKAQQIAIKTIKNFRNQLKARGKPDCYTEYTPHPHYYGENVNKSGMDFVLIPYLENNKGGIAFRIQEDASANLGDIYEENDILSELENDNWSFLDRGLSVIEKLAKEKEGQIS